MRKFLTVIATAGVLAFTAAPAALAHTELDTTSPKAGEVVKLAPTVIQLTFNEPPLADGSQVALTDAKGNAIETEPAEVDGATVTVVWPIDMPSGAITVNWRAVADDGHVVQGTYSFTYKPGDAGTPSQSAAAPSDAPTADASATPIAVTASAPSGEGSQTSHGLSFGVTAAVLVVAGGLLILLFAKRR